jgi:hypothetical protein
MGRRFVPVLEDLDRDDDRISGARRQRREVPADQTGGALWGFRGQLGQGGRRHVEPQQVETLGDQGQVVPPVAAADVQAPRRSQAVGAGRRDDLLHKRERRVVEVAVVPELRLPGGHDERVGHR